MDTIAISQICSFFVGSLTAIAFVISSSGRF